MKEIHEDMKEIWKKLKALVRISPSFDNNKP